MKRPALFSCPVDVKHPLLLHVAGQLFFKSEGVFSSPTLTQTDCMDDTDHAEKRKKGPLHRPEHSTSIVDETVFSGIVSLDLLRPSVIQSVICRLITATFFPIKIAL